MVDYCEDNDPLTFPQINPILFFAHLIRPVINVEGEITY